MSVAQEVCLFRAFFHSSHGVHASLRMCQGFVPLQEDVRAAGLPEWLPALPARPATAPRASATPRASTQPPRTSSAPTAADGQRALRSTPYPNPSLTLPSTNSAPGLMPGRATVAHAATFALALDMRRSAGRPSSDAAPAAAPDGGKNAAADLQRQHMSADTQVGNAIGRGGSAGLAPHPDPAKTLGVSGGRSSSPKVSAAGAPADAVGAIARAELPGQGQRGVDMAPASMGLERTEALGGRPQGRGRDKGHGLDNVQVPGEEEGHIQGQGQGLDAPHASMGSLGGARASGSRLYELGQGQGEGGEAVVSVLAEQLQRLQAASARPSPALSPGAPARPSLLPRPTSVRCIRCLRSL